MKNYKAAELVEVLFAKIGNNQNSNPKKKKEKKKNPFSSIWFRLFPWQIEREREGKGNPTYGS